MATREECIEAIMRSGANELEAESIVSNIEAYARESASVEETARKTRNRFESDKRNAMLERRQLLLTAVRRDALESDLVKAQHNGVAFVDWITAKLVGSHLDFAGSRDSVAKNFAGMMKNLQGNLEKRLGSIENARVLLEKDPTFAKNVHREMIDPESTQDATARQVAQVFSEAIEDMRQRVNRAGGNIGRLDNYAPQSHDGKKLLSVPLRQWREFIGVRLDWERSFPDVTDTKEREQILSDIWKR